MGLACSALASGAALAQPGSAEAARLPASVEAALARAKLPRDAVSALVMDVSGAGAPRLAWRTHVPMNPASVMKLVTTYTALGV